MNLYALNVQATGSNAECALTVNGSIIAKETVNKTLISKNLAPILKKLAAQTPPGSFLAYLAVCRGPAPFSSLRSVIATINGFAYALQLPVVSLDGIALLATEFLTKKPFVILLNAYNQELYYAIYNNSIELMRGCVPYATIELLLGPIVEDSRFIVGGSGILLAKEHLEKAFSKKIEYVMDQVTASSIERLSEEAYKKFLHNEITPWARPLYLKEVAYKKSLIS